MKFFTPEHDATHAFEYVIPFSPHTGAYNATHAPAHVQLGARQRSLASGAHAPSTTDCGRPTPSSAPSLAAHTAQHSFASVPTPSTQRGPYASARHRSRHRRNAPSALGRNFTASTSRTSIGVAGAALGATDARASASRARSFARDMREIHRAPRADDPTSRAAPERARLERAEPSPEETPEVTPQTTVTASRDTPTRASDGSDASPRKRAREYFLHRSRRILGATRSRVDDDGAMMMRGERHARARAVSSRTDDDARAKDARAVRGASTMKNDNGIRVRWDEGDDSALERASSGEYNWFGTTVHDFGSARRVAREDGTPSKRKGGRSLTPESALNAVDDALDVAIDAAVGATSAAAHAVASWLSGGKESASAKRASPRRARAVLGVVNGDNELAPRAMSFGETSRRDDEMAALRAEMATTLSRLRESERAREELKRQCLALQRREVRRDAVNGNDPDVSALVDQLQAQVRGLMSEKAKLQSDNHRLSRENKDLHEFAAMCGAVSCTSEDEFDDFTPCASPQEVERLEREIARMELAASTSGDCSY